MSEMPDASSAPRHLDVLRDIILGGLQSEIESGEWEFSDAEIIAALHLAAQEWGRDYLDRHVYDPPEDDDEEAEDEEDDGTSYP